MTDIAPTEFRKSSYSGENAGCVEIAHTSTSFALRDSKHTASPVLSMTSGHGHTFLTAVKSGHFNQ